MDDGASLSALPLPVVNLGQKAEEGFLRVGHVAVRGPAQELEVAHHELAFLQLRRERVVFVSPCIKPAADAPHVSSSFTHHSGQKAE